VSDFFHSAETIDRYRDVYLDAQRFIEDNAGNRGVTLSDFTTQRGYSQRQVQRALSWFDTNWRRMLLDQRMKRARELLHNTTDPVNRVAEQVGYDHSQFSRTFKAEEGMTPEEYRER